MKLQQEIVTLSWLYSSSVICESQKCLDKTTNNLACKAIHMCILTVKGLISQGKIEKVNFPMRTDSYKKQRFSHVHTLNLNKENIIGFRYPIIHKLILKTIKKKNK